MGCDFYVYTFYHFIFIDPETNEKYQFEYEYSREPHWFTYISDNDDDFENYQEVENKQMESYNSIKTIMQDSKWMIKNQDKIDDIKHTINCLKNKSYFNDCIEKLNAENNKTDNFQKYFQFDNIVSISKITKAFPRD